MILIISICLAVVSAFFVHPSWAYLDYIDWRSLVLLWSLMLVVAGYKQLGLFQMLGQRLMTGVHTLRQITLLLLGLCFFTSMLVTNDVALITFVPFSVVMLKMAEKEEHLLVLVVLETIAANLGSMLTPIGNPQNLLLYSVSGMGALEFMAGMLPLSLVALALLFVLGFCLKNHPLTADVVSEHQSESLWKNWRLWVYTALFLVCLGNVFYLYPYWVMGLVVALTLLLVAPYLICRADYSLLLTFVALFIFIGNMRRIPAVSSFLSAKILGNELWMGALLSQVISNVPAAMMLSGFTTNFKALLYGVNIGGLGTMIASMASLISYRFYTEAYPKQRGAYFKTFTIYNVLCLVIMLGAGFVLLRLVG